MDKQYFVEDRRALSVLTESLNLAAKPQSWLVDQIRDHLPKVKAARRFNWETTNGWDCGRQDSLGDRFDMIFSRWYALKTAWRIQHGDARELKKLSDAVLGDA